MITIYNLCLLAVPILIVIAVILVFRYLYHAEIYNKKRLFIYGFIFVLSIVILIFISEVFITSKLRKEFCNNINNSTELIIKNNTTFKSVQNDSLSFYREYFLNIFSKFTRSGAPSDGKITLLCIANNKQYVYYLMLSKSKYIGNTIWVTQKGWFNVIIIGYIPNDKLLYKYFEE